MSRRSSVHWRDAWVAASRAMGARFHDLSSRYSPDGAAVQLTTEYGTITLVRNRAEGDDPYVHELRAPFWNRRAVHFDIFPTPLLKWPLAIRRFFGTPRDVQVGDSSLNRRYYIATESPVEVQGLLSVVRIRQLLLLLPRFEISAKSRAGRGNFPHGVDEIYCFFREAPQDAERIQLIFELVSEVLRWLADDGADYTDPVRLSIKTLGGPSGSVWGSSGRGSTLLLWDGDPARMRAAQALGTLGDERAFQPLLRALEDSSEAVRLVAVRSLGTLGDRRALAALIPLLGEADGDALGVGAVAAEALGALGGGALVSAFEQALAGDSGRLCALAGSYRSQVVEALARSLKKADRRAFGSAYKALADLGAVEALPVLRKKVAEVTIANIRQECQAAIDALEALQSLPRPAESPADPTGTLPRPAAPAPIDTRALPRPAAPRVGEQG